MNRQVYIIYYGLHERRQRAEQHNTHNIHGPYCINKRIYRKDHISLGTDYYSIRTYYERDSAYLGFIDSFMQDGPQLILQVRIRVDQRGDVLKTIFSSLLRSTFCQSDTPQKGICPARLVRNLTSLARCFVSHTTAHPQLHLILRRHPSRKPPRPSFFWKGAPQ